MAMTSNFCCRFHCVSCVFHLLQLLHKLGMIANPRAHGQKCPLRVMSTVWPEFDCLIRSQTSFIKSFSEKNV